MSKFDVMIVAIDQCYQVDELEALAAGDFDDKVRALEAYARIAQNTQSERKLAKIRRRAERECLKLLKESGAQVIL